MMTSAIYDMSGMKSGLDGVQSSVSQVSGALQSLGIINSDTAKYLTMGAGALQIATGMLGIAQVLHARVVAKTAQETAMSAALVAMNSWNPVGWSKIAIATTATAVASVGMYAIIREIKADLSTPTGRQQAIREATA